MCLFSPVTQFDEVHKAINGTVFKGVFTCNTIRQGYLAVRINARPNATIVVHGAAHQLSLAVGTRNTLEGFTDPQSGKVYKSVMRYNGNRAVDFFYESISGHVNADWTKDRKQGPCTRHLTGEATQYCVELAIVDDALTFTVNGTEQTGSWALPHSSTTPYYVIVALARPGDTATVITPWYELCFFLSKSEFTIPSLSYPCGISLQCVRRRVLQMSEG
jgi:hypothetical protein